MILPRTVLMEAFKTQCCFWRNEEISSTNFLHSCSGWNYCQIVISDHVLWQLSWIALFTIFTVARWWWPETLIWMVLYITKTLKCKLKLKLKFKLNSFLKNFRCISTLFNNFRCQNRKIGLVLGNRQNPKPIKIKINHYEVQRQD